MGIDAWTADKPNASGWYWNRINGTVGIALIMRRDCQLYAWLRFKDAWLSREGWLDYIHGEWLGPITPDSYQQGRVAAAKECEKYARACVHERAVTLDGFTGASAMAGVIRGKQSEAERIAEWCHKLAQQAQGEKGVGDAKV